MEELIEIQWTSGSIDEARRISRYLVEERLVACVQIIPWIESIYMWDNKLETAQESKVVMKTVKSHYPKIQEILLQNHSYQIPEIIVFPVLDCEERYQKWWKESCLSL